jgi:hypothetical protein
MSEHTDHQHTISSACTDDDGCSIRSEMTYAHAHAGAHLPHNHDVTGFELIPVPVDDGRLPGPVLPPVLPPVIILPPPANEPKSSLWADE